MARSFCHNPRLCDITGVGSTAAAQAKARQQRDYNVAIAHRRRKNRLHLELVVPDRRIRLADNPATVGRERSRVPLDVTFWHSSRRHGTNGEMRFKGMSCNRATILKSPSRERLRAASDDGVVLEGEQFWPSLSSPIFYGVRTRVMPTRCPADFPRPSFRMVCALATDRRWDSSSGHITSRCKMTSLRSSPMSSARRAPSPCA